MDRLRGFHIGLTLAFLVVASSVILARMDEHDSVTPSALPTQSLPIGATAQVADTRLELEVARTPEEIAVGLMNRTTLADDRGMVFEIRPPRKIDFWMKNTLIPLDMIFLRDHRILTIHRDVPPCETAACPTYPSGQVTGEVLELRGGRAAELDLDVGDDLVIEYLP